MSLIMQALEKCLCLEALDIRKSDSDISREWQGPGIYCHIHFKPNYRLICQEN